MDDFEKAFQNATKEIQTAKNTAKTNDDNIVTSHAANNPQDKLIVASHTLVSIDLIVAGLFAAFVFLVFLRGFKNARFTTRFKHVFSAIGETVTYLVIPNEKGVQFIDRVIVTPFMRLNIFGLNEGFVKIGAIYNEYFTHGARKKLHNISEAVLPRLDEVAIVISAFQTKQILVHGSRIMVSLSILSFIVVGLLHAPMLLFYDYIVSFFGAEQQHFVTKDIYMIAAISFVSLLVIVSYVWKIIDDIIFIMKTQQDVDNVEFKKFIVDNLSLIVKRGAFIDEEIALDAEKYVLATFFEGGQ